MKRYLVFGYDNYYPNGGRDEVVGDYDTLEDAKAGALSEYPYGTHDVLDMSERIWIKVSW